MPIILIVPNFASTYWTLNIFISGIRLPKTDRRFKYILLYCLICDGSVSKGIFAAIKVLDSFNWGAVDRLNLSNWAVKSD
jgi:hypothetical protein